jgi:hypothetical protein
MRPQRLLAASATLALPLLALLAGRALAEDGKAYPGSACQRQFDHVAASISRSQATILNVGAQRVKLFCPVAKDIEAGRIKRAEVMYLDNHNQQSVTCELLSLSREGAVVQSSVRQSSVAGTNGTPLPLSFGVHAANPKGTYVLTCELPPFSGAVGASQIITYNVVEE